MPSDRDLFTEEQTMVTMSFGEHLEELRVRLILALAGLFLGVLIVFIPPLDIGKRVMEQMEAPAKVALTKFYKNEYAKKRAVAEAAKTVSDAMQAEIPAESFIEALRRLAPDAKLPEAAAVKGQTLAFPIRYKLAELIDASEQSVLVFDNSLISLGPLETITIYFMVCLVAGLVMASPWVFYQIWAFIAAGLYRHERHYVMRFLPVSLGLFMGGVALCFWFVLPLTLAFLLDFNVWLGVAPTLRLSEWMSFATMLPLVFGVAFQTPLVMLFLQRIGIFTVDDYRSKRKFAILIITIAAAVLTPGQDPISMSLLAAPMIVLYELGIILIARGSKTAAPMRA
ncbi:twin-arginine translocase subunit TatC [Paludisphaera mucosa]|uniref:Sec-independent protein translocase protein TatC n=1 Tax=Paludisphaera mucosa TaxID=3030827 RepID=A0ABT6F5G8_9BACT|nr:twin-arginine translocase subunit TatC [Paludisphaera mucosa]MDG3002659.1 twin-arginine translocase subunit TatC [Paludisphaera mucosa]